MKVFLLKLGVILLLPITFVAVYFINDPFKVLYHYDTYIKSGKPYFIFIDKDVTTTRTFLNNYKKYKYDSYIFGNSRSCNFWISDWEKYINSDKCFHFDGSCESLYAIGKNVSFIRKHGIRIKNALFILDNDILSKVENNPGHIYIMDPAVSGESKWAFQATYFKAYADPQFFKDYVSYLVHHALNPAYEVPRNSNSLCIARDVRQYEPITNEVHFVGFEQQIASNMDSFYNARADLFFGRDTSKQYYFEPVIGDTQRSILNGIAKELAEDSTDFRIVISPLYNQVKLNTKDLDILYAIFGKERVFDFSGKNAITDDVHNYYESYHYRPSVAKMILDSMYKNKYQK